VIFSPKDPALFHGDPHAGNVFHSPSPADPYRIALIDWGLAAEFTLAERKQLAQLMLGLYLGDEKRLANHAEVLVGPSRRPQPARRTAHARESAAAVIEGGSQTCSRSSTIS
jgi:ubiquinone biosynthesis protein